MLTNVADEFSRPPAERLSRQYTKAHKKKQKQTRLRKVDESQQDDWLDRTRQGVHCSLFCGGSKCKLESWEAMRDGDKLNAAIEGLNSSWVGKDVIASQRPSTSLFVKYPLIQQFRAKQVTGVLNLQEKGEHGGCGPDGVYESSGYSYNGAEDLMPHGISYYEFPWPDMTAPQQDVVLRSVQVMDYHIKNKGKVLVHCHAGLGRTGLMIACYYVYSQHIPSAQAIALVRRNRPGAIQTTKQAEFINDFERHLWRLSQAFRVEISDALIDVDLFIQRQRLVLHGEQADLYKSVPMFLHLILCRLLNLTKNDEGAAMKALESLGPSSAPDDAILSACRIAINRRRYRVRYVNDESILSFLVCDWFRSMSAPVLSMEDCDQIVEYMRKEDNDQESLPRVIRRIMSKPARHTLGMVTSAFHLICQKVSGESLKKYAFHCLVDSFNHAFNPVKLRHSPVERALIQDFFTRWGASVGDIYFNYDAVPDAHRTIKRVAFASSIVLEATEGKRTSRPSQPVSRATSNLPAIARTGDNNGNDDGDDNVSRARSEGERSKSTHKGLWRFRKTKARKVAFAEQKVTR